MIDVSDCLWLLWVGGYGGCSWYGLWWVVAIRGYTWWAMVGGCDTWLCWVGVYAGWVVMVGGCDKWLTWVVLWVAVCSYGGWLQSVLVAGGRCGR